jgi:hypothetical protein
MGRAALAQDHRVYAKQLAAMGFSKKEPGDLFVLERAEQGGTLAGAGA